MLTKKTTKKRGTEKVCPQKECRFSEPYEEDEEADEASSS
jgi:DNA topoisomerase-1